MNSKIAAASAALLMLAVMASTASAGLKQVSTCRTLGSPGPYALAADLHTSDSSCITVAERGP